MYQYFQLAHCNLSFPKEVRKNELILIEVMKEKNESLHLLYLVDSCQQVVKMILTHIKSHVLEHDVLCYDVRLMRASSAYHTLRIHSVMSKKNRKNYYPFKCEESTTTRNGSGGRQRESCWHYKIHQYFISCARFLL